jgi:hypothetical protein
MASPGKTIFSAQVSPDLSAAVRVVGAAKRHKLQDILTEALSLYIDANRSLLATFDVPAAAVAEAH